MIEIIPLGGLGEIGSNMVAWSDGDDGFIIDCGILFPYEDVFDLNYLIPSFDHLDPTFYKTLLITHAHEDHIGAIVHVLKWNPTITILTTSFARVMMQRRLKEHNIIPNFKEWTHAPHTMGKWSVHAIDINHSTPETQCLVVNHMQHKVSFCYSSDFKINLSAVDGPAFDPSIVKKIMAPFPTRVAMLDSTNILNSGKTIDEGALIPGLEKLISNPGRCFISFFTSNVRRLNNIVSLAKKNHRQIAVMGRSVWNTIHAAIEAGVAEFKLEDFSAVEDLLDRENEMLMVIVSGCQGDFLSALRRFSYGDDPLIKIKKGDRVIFSSKVIPGNEDKVSRMYNKIVYQGGQVVTASDELIHCSGHPGQKDLQIFISGCDFTHSIPVHGETYFLYKHQDFIHKFYPKIKVILLHNGEKIEIYGTEFKVKPYLSWNEPKIIHGKLLEIERSQISQRRKLASLGAVFITTHDKKEHWVIDFQGLPMSLDLKRDQLLEVLFEHRLQEGRSKDHLQKKELVRIKCRQFLQAELGYKPVCIIH